MFAAKVATYSVTIAAMFLFAFLELRLKRRLTNEAIEPTKLVSDFGIIGDLSERLKRERFLQALPKQKLYKYKTAVGLKFLFAAILVAEVLLLQK